MNASFETLCEFFDVDPQNKRVKALFAEAWKSAHQFGENEVIYHFEDLMKVEGLIQ